MRAERRVRELAAFEREFADMLDVARADKYRRAALGEIVLTDSIHSDARGVWPVSIPHRVMCRRVLEWNL